MDEGCPHECEYCQGLDEAIAAETSRRLREWGERMRALPEGHPDRLAYERQMQWFDTYLQVRPHDFWSNLTGGPVTFKVWEDLDKS